MSRQKVDRRTALKVIGSATAVSGTAIGSKQKNQNEFAGVSYDLKTGEILNELTAEIRSRRENLEGELRFNQTPNALEINSLPLKGGKLVDRQTNAFPGDAGEQFSREVGKKSFSDFRMTIANDREPSRSFPLEIQASSVDDAGVSGIIKPTPDRTDRFAFALEPVRRSERTSHVVEEVENEITSLFSGGDR